MSISIVGTVVCGFKLTKRSVRCLVDLSSVNCTDVAHNWFGTCCYSFGGTSEKLVTKYVKSCRCAEGTCLLTTASIILCKDDIAGLKPLEAGLVRRNEDKESINNASSPNNDGGAFISDGSPLLQDASSNIGSEHCPTEADEDHNEKRSCASPRG